MIFTAVDLVVMLLAAVALILSQAVRSGRWADRLLIVGLGLSWAVLIAQWMVSR